MTINSETNSTQTEPLNRIGEWLDPFQDERISNSLATNVDWSEWCELWCPVILGFLFALSDGLIQLYG